RISVYRCGDAVSDFAVVQDRSPTGGSSHHIDLLSLNFPEIVEAQRWLIASKRERRATPRVDAEDRFCSACRARQKRAVARHVLGATARRDEEQTPAAVTSPGVHRVLNCHSYEHHNQAR